MAFRHALDVANHFWQDANDYHKRFTREWNRVSDVKRTRIRACVDLRFANECLFKSLIVFQLDANSCPTAALKVAVDHRHDLLSLRRAVEEHPPNLNIPLSELIDNLDKIPVALRYSIESSLLVKYGEIFYNNTIRNDCWVNELAKQTGIAIEHLGIELNRHSSVVRMDDLLFELLNDDTLDKNQVKMIKRWW